MNFQPDRRRDQQREDEVADARAGDEQQAQRDRAEDHRGAQVGLLEQQHHHQAGHQQRRQEADGERRAPSRPCARAAYAR